MINNTECDIKIDNNTNPVSLQNLMFKGKDVKDNGDVTGNYGVTYNINLSNIDLKTKKVKITLMQDPSDRDYANLVGFFDDGKGDGTWQSSIRAIQEVSYDLNDLFGNNPTQPKNSSIPDYTQLTNFKLALPAGSYGDWKIEIVDR